MKRPIFILSIIIALIGVAPLPACETCVPPNTSDPGGNVHNYPECFNQTTGNYSACVSGTSSDSTCPYTYNDGSCSSGSNCGNHCIQNPTSVTPSHDHAMACSVDASGRCTVASEGSFLD